MASVEATTKASEGMMNSNVSSPDDKRLLEAAASGQTDCVLQLIEENGQQLHMYKDQDGKSALHLAAAAGHTETVSALLLNGADVSTQDFTGHTALQKAAAEGHVDVAKQLISRGSPVDHQDDVHGNTALHEASWKGFSKTVEVLCKNKSNYYLRNRGGFSPLHLCCQNGHNESCRVLLRAGCKPNIKNNYGDTPLHTAARYGHAGVARILISATCNPNLQNKNGDSPLHIAAAMGRRKLVRILLEAGTIEISNLNQQKETALDIAMRKGNEEIATMIRHPPPKNKCEEVVAQVEANDDNDDDNKSREAVVDGAKQKTRKSKKDKMARYRLKHRPSRNKLTGDPKWSPYGCHYYPDLTEFPEPNVTSLPNEPLQSGEQYFLDLAGNIKKGPVGSGSTCYCAPFIHRFEHKMNSNKKDLVKHLETTHGKLATRLTHLEKRTRDQISNLSNSMKESLAQERVECQDRMERRAIRDRVAIDRQQAVRHLMLRGDLSAWLDSRVSNMEESASKSQMEQVALMRTLLRGSRRKKRAILSELQSGSLRRALSEDEMDPEDDEESEVFARRHNPIEIFGQDTVDESLTVQSEFGYHHHNLSLTPFRHDLEDRLEGLKVSDHPHNLHVYQNTLIDRQDQDPRPVPSVRVRRNSAGDETTLFCDFGDFNTQELISSPLDLDNSVSLLNTSNSNNNNHVNSNSNSNSMILYNSGPASFGTNPDVLSYSTNSESQSYHSSSVASHHAHPSLGVANYQNYQSDPPPMIQRPVPFTPVAVLPPVPPPKSMPHPLYQNTTRPPPLLPPKSSIPPPYRPPPQQLQQLHVQAIRPYFMPPIEEDFIKTADLTVANTVVGVATSTALASSDGGSHDSHNDSGYCAVRGSGGPSPSLSGSQGRPDSRGPLEMPEATATNSSSGTNNIPLLKASLGPVLSNNGPPVAPRIRQLQQQLSLAGNNSNRPGFGPRGSLV